MTSFTRYRVSIITHFIACGYSSFTSAAIEYSIIGICHPSPILLFMDIWDASRLGAVVNKVTVNSVYMYPGLEVELLNCRVCIFTPSYVMGNLFPVEIRSCSHLL